MTVSTESGEQRAIRVRILEKEVQIGCRAGEEDALLQAAAHVDASMRELRHRRPTSSIEKIAIVTAINTASDLLKARQQPSIDESLAKRLQTLNEQVESLLAERDTES